MNKKKICFVAQFAPPMHGLSKAVETLYNSYLQNEFEFEKIDIKDNKKIFINLIKIIKSHADLYYFTISQSKGGNLRDLIILKLLEMQNKKCLIHLHGGYYRKLIDNDVPNWQKKANYNAISKLSGAIVLGNSLKNIFKDVLPNEKIFVVPNCVDDEYLMSDEEFENKIANIENRKIKHVLYLSNFIRSKGYPEVLELARIEKERCSDGEERKFHFDFAGKFFEQSEEKFFFEFIKEKCLEEYITYHGVVSGDKKRELLKNCDVFTLITKYPKEGQPISILEAMGNGMVIVTTDHAGIPDIVKRDNGIVIENENLKDVYYKLRVIDIENIARNNRKIVKKLYAQKNYIQNMKNVYEELTR